MVKELLCEIMEATGESYFNVDEARLQAQAHSFLAGGSYVVLLASNSENAEKLGFLGLFEGHALYAGGVFGVIPELYVRPAFRSQGIGALLLDHAVEYGISRGWKRLEVTTPPLPIFGGFRFLVERS
jgi:GNAT superfamily N-acetyltransferase